MLGVGEPPASIRHLPIAGGAAQLFDYFDGLEQRRSGCRMAVADTSARGVDDNIAAVGELAAPYRSGRRALARRKAEIFVEHEFGRGVDAVDLRYVYFIGTDARIFVRLLGCLDRGTVGGEVALWRHGEEMLRLVIAAHSRDADVGLA